MGHLQEMPDGIPKVQQNVLRSDVVLVRGRIRRVWKKRLIELTDDGILKYYDAEKEVASNSGCSTLTISRTEIIKVREKNSSSKCSKQREGEANQVAQAKATDCKDDPIADKEWCDVSESCYPEHQNAAKKTFSSEEEKSFSQNIDSEFHIQEKPRAVLLVLRARLLDPSSFKDAKSGLPADKWGFLFHGHVLFYESTGLVNPYPSAGSNLADSKAGNIEGQQTNEGNPHHHQFYSRPFHVAVDRRKDAIEWVRALQSVAVATSCSVVTPDMPPRYATLDNLPLAEDTEEAERSTIDMKPEDFRNKWGSSLLNPLRIYHSSNDLKRESQSDSEFSQDKSSNKELTDRKEIEMRTVSNTISELGRKLGDYGEQTSDGTKQPQKDHEIRGSLDNFPLAYITWGEIKDCVYHNAVKGQERMRKLPYWCGLGLAFSAGCLGAMMVGRGICDGKAGGSIAASTLSRFSTRGGGVIVINEGSNIHIRIELAALSIAIAIACGFKLGRHWVSSDNLFDNLKRYLFSSPSVSDIPNGGGMQHVENDRIRNSTTNSSQVASADLGIKNDGMVQGTPVTYLPSPLPKYPENKGKSCWSEPDAVMFKVRGRTYLEDRVKVQSAPAIFKCKGVDIWLTDDPQSNISRHPAVLGGQLFKCKDKDSTSVDGIFLINFLLPFGNFVAYFDVPPQNKMPAQVAKVWKEFCVGDQQYRDARLKLLPIVVEGPWIVKTVVGNGSSPALLGKAVPLQYYFTCANKASNDTVKECFRNCNVYEVDVIISASNIAKGILNIVKGHTKYLTIAFALILEAADSSELPENVLCTFAVHSIHLDECPHLEDYDDQTTGEDVMD